MEQDYSFNLIRVIYFQVRLQMVGYSGHSKLRKHSLHKNKEKSLNANASHKRRFFQTTDDSTEILNNAFAQQNSLYLQSIEYNYCICVYMYPEEFFFKSTNRDYSMSQASFVFYCQTFYQRIFQKTS